MTAQNHLAINGTWDQGMPESTKVIQDGSYSDEALEIAVNRALGFGNKFQFYTMYWD